MDVFAFVFLSSSLFLFYFVFSDVANSITQSQSLSDSKGTNLVSKNGGFVLGFFNTGNSNNRYLGIWYNNIPVRTVVWVANWRNPITDSSGVLKLNSSGSLLLSQNKTIAWLANSIKEAGSPVVELLDSGNLVLREENKENPESYLWQSFDYPSDTWLPGMKLGWTGLERRLTAWKSPDDPSPGELSCGIELNNYPEIVMKCGSKKCGRTGPWNGIGFSGALSLKANPVYNFTFVSSKDEVAANGREVYIRMPASMKEKMKNKRMIGQNIDGQNEDLELPFFSLATIAIATNKFPSNNKLGEGGFGLVYKGILADGQEIAMKRLPQNSRQGLSEFKNEVISIAKSQHRNLVRLLGL
ncbi:hypothetical protein RGQ29_027178 [Quercus rubra]|uniref:Uncharacterized protein n=1 Tax=Quercus rubra TaxID=3512 RepID=A0AAN7IH47_QUERU|nr:hypothetical protein RGQ29_027178 [Quercus rubra]